ncbi:MAG: hypothetical protein IJ068_00670 [Bacilli bacterium]|nr:hypothetical protein [Bacilli bacterium]
MSNIIAACVAINACTNFSYNDEETEQINKLIISLDESNNLQRIFVVGENNIYRFSNKKYSQKELIKIYSNYLKLLKDQNQEFIYGFKKNEQIDMLIEMKKFEINNNNLTVKIIENKQLLQYTVYYEDGTQKVQSTQNNKTEYIRTIVDICNIYGIPITTFDETISTLNELGIYKEVIAKKKKLMNKLHDFFSK